MNGIHDLGGTDGHGPVHPDVDEPVFRNEWERSAFGLFSQMFAGGYFNIDQFRHSIEKMDPVEYLTHPYYAHWVHAFEHLGVAKDVDPADLERRTALYLAEPDAPLPPTVNETLAELVGVISAHGATARREVDRPARFAVGDVVSVDPSVPFDHTRRTSYVRGRTGTVVLAHGASIYPDAAGNGHGEGPEHLYTVRFAAEELYGTGNAHPRDVVHIDLWEPYLRAPAARPLEESLA